MFIFLLYAVNSFFAAAAASHSPPVQTAASWCNGLSVDAPVLIPLPRLVRSAFACLDDMLFRAVVKARRGPSPWVQVTYA